MKKNVLVFPCGSEIGLEIHRSLNASTHFNVIGASSVEDHGRYVYETYVGGMPFIDEPAFASSLDQVIVQYDIDYIFPAHDSAVLKIAQMAATNDLKCKAVTSPLETCEIARSKFKTYKRLQAVVRTPKIYSKDNIKETDLPLFLKPDIGQGSKGTQLVKTMDDVDYFLRKDSSLLALEYLPGREYTIDCFTSEDGELLFWFGRERQRVNNGISVSSAPVDHPQFEKLARAINEELKFKGVWFFQVKESGDGELALLEIAPRVAGTMGLVRCLGVNLPLLSLFNAEGHEVDVLKNNFNLSIDRALENKYSLSIKYSHVYLDYDDLVIFEDKVNPLIMAFIFQCINEGISVHLLTKHTGDLENSLKQHHLENIFDEVIWIRNGDPKYEYIAEPNSSIFIDDSHVERMEVYRRLGVPVFDAHSIEALIN